MSTDHHSGLEEVRVLSSKITLIEGSRLFYRGIAIEELALHSSFEDVAYLLWYGRLPGSEELKRFTEDIQSNSELCREVKECVYHLPREAHPQGVLSYLISAVALHDRGIDNKISFRIFAQAPILMCAYERYRKGKSIIEPKKNLSFAGNCLYMLYAEEPDEVSVQALNTCLILYAEHELNASTFATRITTGTMADMYSAIIVGINTLKGMLHGGANQQAMEMILNIQDPENVDEWVEKKLTQKEKIMGFGHRVYKNGDPRAIILKKICKKLCGDKNYEKYYLIAEKLEIYMKKEKKLLPNVDFYSALILYVLGFPIDMFTTLFTVSRIAGWVAHITEQYEDNRLIRPRAQYTGKRNVKYIFMKERI